MLTWLEMWDTSDSSEASPLIRMASLMSSLSPPCPYLSPAAQSAHHMLAPPCHKRPVYLKSTISCSPIPSVSLHCLSSLQILGFKINLWICVISLQFIMLIVFAGSEVRCTQTTLWLQQAVSLVAFFPVDPLLLSRDCWEEAGWRFSGSWPGAKDQLYFC